MARVWAWALGRMFVFRWLQSEVETPAGWPATRVYRRSLALSIPSQKKTLITRLDGTGGEKSTTTFQFLYHPNAERFNAGGDMLRTEFARNWHAEIMKATIYVAALGHVSVLVVGWDIRVSFFYILPSNQLMLIPIFSVLP